MSFVDFFIPQVRSIDFRPADNPPFVVDSPQARALDSGRIDLAVDLSKTAGVALVPPSNDIFSLAPTASGLALGESIERKLAVYFNNRLVFAPPSDSNVFPQTNEAAHRINDSVVLTDGVSIAPVGVYPDYEGGQLVWQPKDGEAEIDTQGIRVRGISSPATGFFIARAVVRKRNAADENYFLDSSPARSLISIGDNITGEAVVVVVWSAATQRRSFYVDGVLIPNSDFGFTGAWNEIVIGDRFEPFTEPAQSWDGEMWNIELATAAASPDIAALSQRTGRKFDNDPNRLALIGELGARIRPQVDFLPDAPIRYLARGVIRSVRVYLPTGWRIPPRQNLTAKFDLNENAIQTRRTLTTKPVDIEIPIEWRDDYASFEFFFRRLMAQPFFVRFRGLTEWGYAWLVGEMPTWNFQAPGLARSSLRAKAIFDL